MNTGRHTAILATLTPEVRQLCERYQQAKEVEQVAIRAYREALAAKRTAQNTTALLAEQISQPSDEAPISTIVYNLRNGRLYELRDQEDYYRKFIHLNPKTAYAHTAHCYAWGPMLVLPNSHPFVQKRLNARLAERLKGDGG